MARPGLLREIFVFIDDSIRTFDERTGKKHKPPYPFDSPCYYCKFQDHFNEIEKKPDAACVYCIQNPDAEIFDDVKIDIKL